MGSRWWAVRDVSSFKSDLIASVNSRSSAMGVEKCLFELGKVIGCPMIAHNLVGLVKRTKYSARELLHQRRYTASEKFVEDGFRFDEDVVRHRRDPEYTRLRGALVKTYCTAMRSLCRGRNRDYVEALVKARELEQGLGVFVSMRASWPLLDRSVTDSPVDEDNRKV